ncbi:MAG TPA: DUF6111 family protein [Rhizomicrobium sp.]|jgi:hypothetical protein
MIRVVLTRTLLFLLPFVLYGVWLLLIRLREKTPGPHTPWTGLVVAGLALVAASFVFVGLTEGESTSGVYVPPHVEHGRIVPGHVEKTR